MHTDITGGDGLVVGFLLFFLVVINVCVFIYTFPIEMWCCIECARLCWIANEMFSRRAIRIRLLLAMAETTKKRTLNYCCYGCW